MIDPEIQKLLDKPLDGEDPARINKVWLPKGKARASRGSKPEYHGDSTPGITPAQARERAKYAKDSKMATVLSYYAKTTIPFERIAEHTKLDMKDVIRAMKDRGRHD